MNRRHYLASLATLSTAAIAGCSDDEDPTESPTPTEATESPAQTDAETEETPTASEPAADIEAAVDSLREELESEGIDIDHLYYDDPGYIVLDYFTNADSQNELDDDIVTISRALARIIDEFGDAEILMECLALTDDTFFEFDIELDWARAYATGDLSDEEYTNRIRDTVN